MMRINKQTLNIIKIVGWIVLTLVVYLLTMCLSCLITLAGAPLIVNILWSMLGGGVAGLTMTRFIKLLSERKSNE